LLPLSEAPKPGRSSAQRSRPSASAWITNFQSRAPSCPMPWTRTMGSASRFSPSRGPARYTITFPPNTGSSTRSALAPATPTPTQSAGRGSSTAACASAADASAASASATSVRVLSTRPSSLPGEDLLRDGPVDHLHLVDRLGDDVAYGDARERVRVRGGQAFL